MKYSKTTFMLIACSLLVACSDNGATPSQLKSVSVSEGELIPRSMQEKAKYYLISVESDGNYLKTLHSRVSAMSHGYSVTRIDCNNQRYQDLGYGEDTKSNINMYDKVQWTDLVSGSSKYDLVTFVCRRSKK